MLASVQLSHPSLVCCLSGDSSVCVAPGGVSPGPHRQPLAGSGGAGVAMMSHQQGEVSEEAGILRRAFMSVPSS